MPGIREKAWNEDTGPDFLLQYGSLYEFGRIFQLFQFFKSIMQRDQSVSQWVLSEPISQSVEPKVDVQDSVRSFKKPISCGHVPTVRHRKTGFSGHLRIFSQLFLDKYQDGLKQNYF